MTRISPNKEMNQLVALAEQQGWTVEKTKNNHLRWTSPAGRNVFSPSTPSDGRFIKNTIRDLKAYGFIELKRSNKKRRK